ncbi:MAG: hypothetical protein R3249_01175 [Nitriliruptorales bacterium]|nr:hypothetical protein [Nitriliruptorales bacterium]
MLLHGPPGSPEPPDPLPSSPGDDPSPRLVDRLRAIDVLVVPPLQRSAVRSVAWLSRMSQRLVAAEDGIADGRPVALATQHSRVVALLIGVLLLLGTGIHMDRYPELIDNGDGLQELTEAGDVPVGDTPLAGGVTAQVGPTLGDDVATYITDRTQVLAGLPSDAVRVAVISFDELVDGATVDMLLGEVDAVSIQFINPQSASRPLSSDVEGSVASTIERAVGAVRIMAREERDNVQALLDDGNVTDPDFIADYRRRVDEMNALLEVLDEAPAIVFAVVVEGRVDALRALALQPAVRLVDVAPAETTVEESAFWGLLPTDIDVVTFGKD